MGWYCPLAGPNFDIRPWFEFLYVPKIHCAFPFTRVTTVSPTIGVYTGRKFPAVQTTTEISSHWVSPREPKQVEFSRWWRYLPENGKWIGGWIPPLFPPITPAKEDQHPNAKIRSPCFWRFWELSFKRATLSIFAILRFQAATLQCAHSRQFHCICPSYLTGSYTFQHLEHFTISKPSSSILWYATFDIPSIYCGVTRVSWGILNHITQHRLCLQCSFVNMAFFQL